MSPAGGGREDGQKREEHKENNPCNCFKDVYSKPEVGQWGQRSAFQLRRQNDRERERGREIESGDLSVHVMHTIIYNVHKSAASAEQSGTLRVS